MKRLFRSEVHEGREYRLHGEVILTETLSNWALVAMLLSIVTISAGFALAGHYARTERVIGRVVPDGALTRIVATRPGTVVKLQVREGDHVKIGQPLLSILVAQSSGARVDPSAAEISAIDLQHALVRRQIRLSRQTNSQDIEKLHSSISGYHDELSSINQQISLQQKMVQSAKDSFEPLSTLVNSGYVSRLQYESRRQSLLTQEENLTQLERSRSQLLSSIQQSHLVLKGLATQMATKVIDLRNEDANLMEKRIAAENMQSYVITSPIAGTISGLQITKGSSVTTQIPIMMIIADDVQMVADLYAPSRAIGFARKGQEVRIMYDSFPYQRFGNFKGYITYISNTALAPNEIDAPIPSKEPVYRIRVSLPKESFNSFGEHVSLRAGMTLSATIVLDRRSFFGWILEPINSLRNRN